MVSQSRPVFASAASTTPAHDSKNSPTGISSSTSGFGVKWAYIGDYFKTWNWEVGFRYSRNEGQDLSVGEASQPGLRQALLDTNPATAFNPFLGINGINSAAARAQVYVTLHNSGEYELPIYYATFNGDLFNLPAAQCRLQSAVSTTRRDSTVIGMR